MSREFERKFAADAKTLAAMEAAWGAVFPHHHGDDLF